MKSFTSIHYIFSLLILFGIASCSRTESDFDKLPASTSSVVQIRLPQLVRKANMNYIRDSVGYDLLKLGMGFMGIPDFIEDRSRLGIDFTRNIYLFRPDSLPETPVMALFYLESMDSLLHLLQMTDNSVFVQDEDEIKKIKFAFGQLVIKGNQGYFCSEKTASYTEMMSSWFEIPASESLKESQADIEDYFQRKNDISLWAGHEKIDPQEWEGRSLPAKSLYRKILGGVDFERGLIKGNYTESGGRLLSEMYRQAFKNPFRPDLLRGLDLEEAPTFLSLHLHPIAQAKAFEKLNSFDHLLESSGYDDYFKPLFEQSMTNISDFFDGRSLWAINGTIGPGLKKIQKAVPRWHIAISLKKKSDESAIRSYLNEDASFQKSDDFYRFKGSVTPLYFYPSEDVLYISNDATYLDSFRTAPPISVKASTALIKKIKEHPLYLRAGPDAFDLLGEGGGALDMISIARMVGGNALKAVHFIELSAGQDQEFPLTADLTVELKNKDRNALEAILISIFKNLSFDSFKDLL